MLAIAGGYGVGMTMRVDAAPGAGETVTGGALNQGHGGKGSNQAVAAARLGARVALFTAIGTDAHGAAAKDFWRAEGIDSTSVVEVDTPTMVGFIIVEGSGENRIAIAPGALAELTVAHAERFRSAISEAELLVVSLEIPLDVAARLLEIAEEEGTATVLNPAPAQTLPETMWPSVHYLTPNRSEASILLGLEPQASVDPESVARQLAQRAQATVVLTNGAAGAIVATADGATVIPAARVPKVIDTTGAGDAFTAAFAVALTESASATEAASFAALAGAHAVTIAEVVPSLATRERLNEFRAIIQEREGS